MLKTLVCDDELPALELMATLFKSAPHVELVATCQSIGDAVEAINLGGVDLAVFDIEMPQLSGVDAYRLITADPKPLLIFATAHPEYAVEAFGIDAIDYLLKPLSRDRVEKAVEKALRLHRLIHNAETLPGADMDAARDDRTDFLKLKDAGRFHFIPYREILWVEAAGDYSLVHRLDREVAIRMPLKDLMDRLPPELFVRVHRSSIVSVEQVVEIRLMPKGDATIELTGGAVVKASRSFRDTVLKLPDRR